MSAIHEKNKSHDTRPLDNRPQFIRSSLSLTQKDVERLEKFKDVLELHTNSAAVSALLKIFSRLNEYSANGDDVFVTIRSQGGKKEDNFHLPW